ncbi:2-dehydro-3-deoxygluconokinase [Paracidovorax avenae ATCC 19860]|uniref:2-dehydro-3-deoxygluconokinase n=1 Tax=Paracidovorax avenae (strain ATCC 19860 / DSM 7227 / CCUG 15838 / JCM 20985 / LMG 2117 / NCPPB 1011) TaxID=643561 RepID=F0Q4R7_PARA1|nr:sugar kinase [Paracidovorax avenae]ADX45571.1 2-dehydro-3-deoxygluconokinase [Paracidovorax avenae ATCC 19860]
MNETDFDVVTIGEAMVLFAAQAPGALESVTRFQRFSAGAELNVAIGLARLGLRVGYLSRLGDDSFGRSLLGAMRQEGVCTTLVETTPAQPTGFMLKSRSDDGSDPQVEYFRRGSAASAMGPQDLHRLAAVRARHLHLTGISPALSPGCRELVFETLRWARGQGMGISFDPNLRPRLWPSAKEMARTVNALAGLSDIVLPGVTEGRMLTGRDSPPDIARFYLDAGAGEVLVKLGAEGAWCACRNGTASHVPGFAVDKVIDTVGAGDGFAVGVISARLEGLDLHAAARRANAIGARVVQFPGDSDGLPTRAQLEEALDAHGVD